jgi:hypothetical protein
MNAIKEEKDLYKQVRDVISQKLRNIPPFFYGDLQDKFLMAVTSKLKKICNNL